AAAVPALRRRRAEVGAAALAAARGGRADRRRRGRRLGGVRARARLLRPGALHPGLQGARRLLARRVRRDLREHPRRRVTPIFFATGAEFRAWLEQHHADETELLVGFWKRGTGRPSMTWQESVDAALCFGWIDGVRRGIDAESYSI